MKSADRQTGRWKVTQSYGKREMNAPTLHLNLGSDLIPFRMVHYFFRPRFQLFNECLHSACYCLKLCSKRQISLHSSTHYRANALCPHSLSLVPHFLRQLLSPCPSNLRATLSDTFPPLASVQYFPLSEAVCSSLLTPTPPSLMSPLCLHFSS